MPRTFNKSSRRKNGFRKFNRYVNTGAKVASTAYTALKVAQGVAAMVNTEKKYVDVANLDNPDSNGAVFFVSGIQEGDDNTQRNGRSVRAKSIEIRGRLELNANTPTVCCRCITFIDWASNGVAPAVSDVLKLIDVDSFMNLDNTGKGGRFQVLRNQFMCLSDTGNKMYHYEDYIKLNHHLKYKGTGATVADATQGHLYVLTISDKVTADAPGFFWQTRLRYIDN